jgi:hypothetical protein
MGGFFVSALKKKNKLRLISSTLSAALRTRYYLSDNIKIRTILQGTNCLWKKIKKLSVAFREASSYL